MSFLSGLIVGGMLGLIGGLVGAFFVWRNNKQKIADLIAKAKKAGVALSE